MLDPKAGVLGSFFALRQPLRALLLQRALREPLVNPVELKLCQVRLRDIEETPSEVETRGVDARQLSAHICLELVLRKGPGH